MLGWPRRSSSTRCLAAPLGCGAVRRIQVEEKLSLHAPGRLSVILIEGLRGHHPLFEPEEIRAAFEVPDRPLDALSADQVGQALLAIAREPAHAARGTIDALSPPSRTALIRVYFRLLERAAEERRSAH